MKYIILVSVLFIFNSIGTSQTTETFKIEDSGIILSNRNYSDGNISITQDAMIRKAIKRHIELNNNKFSGHRVQVYFGSGQRAMGEAQNVKKRFLNQYGSSYGAYIVFDSPNFKVQVGDFRTKAEALYFKSMISKTYPNSWVVDVKVNYPVEIIEYQNEK